MLQKKHLRLAVPFGQPPQFAGGGPVIAAARALNFLELSAQHGSNLGKSISFQAEKSTQNPGPGGDSSPCSKSLVSSSPLVSSTGATANLSKGPVSRTKVVLLD